MNPIFWSSDPTTVSDMPLQFIYCINCLCVRIMQCQMENCAAPLMVVIAVVGGEEGYPLRGEGRQAGWLPYRDPYQRVVSTVTG